MEGIKLAEMELRLEVGTALLMYGWHYRVNMCLLLFRVRKTTLRQLKKN